MPHTVLDAVKYLASRCDYASTWDGQGFNSFDADFGHSLAERPDEWGLTAKQEKAALKMLKKYRGQLSAAGIDYDALQSSVVGRPEPVAERKIWIEGDSFVIQINAYRLPDDLATALRSIPDRHYDGARVINTVPIKRSLEVEAFAQRFGFVLDDGAKLAIMANREMALLEQERHEQAIAASVATDSDIELKVDKLYPYQRAGVAYLLDKRRTFLADEMGLGKTRQAIAALIAGDALPALVVCPKSLVTGWREEARGVAPWLNVELCSGSSHIREGRDLYVINYDVLAKRMDAFLPLGLRGLVMDESHYVKNYKAQRTKAIEQITWHLSDNPMVLCISGTPLVNRPAELITQLRIMDRLEDIGGFKHYWKHFCGYDQRGAQNLNELNEVLRANCMVRRLKKDVLTELPPKTWAHVPMELSNIAEYRQVEQDFLDWLYEHTTQDEEGRQKIQSAMKAEAIVRLGVLRKLAAKGKIEAAIDWTKFFLDTDGKLVLFAYHREAQDKLYAALAKYNPRRIASDMDVDQRQQAVKDFQTDESVRVIVCSIKAAGVGLTLTAASNVAFLELDWTPAGMDQAADRCHRIGQRDAVTAWQLVAPATIDGYMIDLLDEKREIITQVLDGRASADPEQSIADEVLDRMLATRGAV